MRYDDFIAANGETYVSPGYHLRKITDGMSLQEIADLLNVTPERIQDIFNGDLLTHKEIKTLADNTRMPESFWQKSNDEWHRGQIAKLEKWWH